MVTTINERQAGGGGTTDLNPVAVGENATASGAGSLAVGVDAGAFADGAVAIGDDTTIDIEDVASIGPRDLFLTDGRSVVFPADQGNQTVADIPITGDAPEGEQHSMLFTVADETALEVFAEADGLGGVQNLSLNLPGDLDATGGVNAADVESHALEVSDSDGNSVLAMDSESSTVALQLFGNDIEGLNKIVPTGDELLVDGDVTISGELTEGSAF